MGADIFFVVFSYVAVSLFNRALMRHSPALSTIDLSDVMGKSAAELSLISSILRNFFITLIVAAVLLLLFTIANWSFFQGFVYSKILNKRFSLGFYKNFLLVNAVWIPSWTVVFILILLGAKLTSLKPLSIILVNLFIYFTLILYPMSMKTKGIMSIKKAFRFGVEKIHYTVPAYLLFVIILIGLGRLRYADFLPSKAASILMVGILLVLLAWTRTYFSNIVFTRT